MKKLQDLTVVIRARDTASEFTRDLSRTFEAARDVQASHRRVIRTWLGVRAWHLAERLLGFKLMRNPFAGMQAAAKRAGKAFAMSLAFERQMAEVKRGTAAGVREHEAHLREMFHKYGLRVDEKGCVE